MKIRKLAFGFALAGAAQVLAGGAVLSRVADATVEVVGDGILAFDDRPYHITPDAAKVIGGKPYFYRTIDGGFAADVVKGGELLVVTPTARNGGPLSQGAKLAALGFVRDASVAPFQAFGSNSCDISDL